VSDLSPSSEAPPAGTALRCPVCGAPVAPEDRFCEVDGTPLTPAMQAAAPTSPAARPARPEAAAGPAQPEPAQAAAGLAQATCPCGRAEDDGDGYCAYCGHRLRPAAPPVSVALLPELAPAPDLGAVTDRGRRHPRNEDAVALARVERDGRPVFVLVVCDGVSSSRQADRAAALAAGTACDALREHALAPGETDPATAMAAAIRAAHAAVCALPETPEGDLDPPGTTLVAALATGARVTVGWVGDSRAYWLGADGAGLLTHDHSWASEAVDRGELSEADAQRAPLAHALTHCLGPLEERVAGMAPEPSVTSFDAPPGCRLVLCSDGLWNYLPRPCDFADLVGGLPPDASAQAVAAALVARALAAGGQDNVTAAVVFLP
jgi:serine/threonine protein phosphatase PrpC